MAPHTDKTQDFLQEADDLAPELESIVDNLKRVAQATVGDLKLESDQAWTSSGERAKVSGDFVKRLHLAAGAVGSAVKAQNDLHRTAATRAKKMTPEQRRLALVKMVSDMPYADRRQLIEALIYEHTRVCRDSGKPADAPKVTFVDFP